MFRNRSIATDAVAGKNDGGRLAPRVAKGALLSRSPVLLRLIILPLADRSPTGDAPPLLE
jgi:hypothetical protein